MSQTLRWLRTLLTRENITRAVTFLMPFLSTMPKGVRKVLIVLIALAVAATTYFTLTDATVTETVKQIETQIQG